MSGKLDTSATIFRRNEILDWMQPLRAGSIPLLSKKAMFDPYNEVVSRFPEIAPHLCDGDEELPYVYFNYIAWWISSLDRSEISNEIIKRISSFSEWCESQPVGEDAGNDPGTILMVGLYESLGSSESGRKVLSSIWPEDYVLSSREYLTQWLGRDDYEHLLTEYKKKPGKAEMAMPRKPSD